MKKLIALLLALCMIACLFAACGEAEDPTDPPETDPAPTNNDPVDDPTDPPETDPQPSEDEPTVDYSAWRVAMVTDYGDITDQSFNQTTYEAGKAWCEARGVDFTYYKPTGDSTAERVASVEQAIEEGYNVLLLPGFAFGETIKETADMYPEVTYIALDVGEGDLGDYTLPANVFSAVYQEELAGYMAGYAAVKLGYTKLGYLGGMAVPAVVRYGYGFVQGCNDAAVELGNAADVNIDYVYGNQFYGDADITAYMDTVYANGCQIVFACGGGIFTSACEAALKVEGAKVIGVDVDQNGVITALYGDETLTVTSAMKGLAATVNTMLAELIENDNWAAYAGKVVTLGLVSENPEENYVGIAPSTQWNDGFTEADYLALVSKLYKGEITVSADTTAMPATEITVTDLGAIK